MYRYFLNRNIFFVNQPKFDNVEHKCLVVFKQKQKCYRLHPQHHRINPVVAPCSHAHDPIEKGAGCTDGTNIHSWQTALAGSYDDVLLIKHLLQRLFVTLEKEDK